MAFLQLAVGPLWPVACTCCRNASQWRTQINMFPASHLEQLEDRQSAGRAWAAWGLLAESCGRGRHMDWVSGCREAKADSTYQ